MDRSRLTPYLLLAVLTLGAGLGMGLGLAEAPSGRVTTVVPKTRAAAPMSPVPKPGCLFPRGPTVTLTDTAPTPTLTVRAGTLFVVLVPAWHFGTATDVHIGNPNVVVEACSVVLPDKGRRAVLVALAPGRSFLSATITPATEAMMPAWSAEISVIARR